MAVKRGDDEVWSYDSFFDVVTQPVTFPLPEHKNPAQCRDEFLKTIFATVERVVIKRPMSQRLQSVREESTTAEGMAILNMMKKSLIVPQLDAMSVSQYRASLTAEQMEKLYTVCLYQFQKAAIQFLSGRLKKQIDTLLQTWPGAVVELPHKLFHWSLESFLHRQKVNQLYLDVLVMERSKADLDCAKFCIDLNEIIRLLDLIREDFGEQRDICHTSSVINDSNYEVNSTWIKDLKNLRKIHQNLDAIIQSNTVRISSQCGLELAAEDDRTEALSLIEMRYRSNWLRSCGDQTNMLLEKKEHVYEEEIKELQNKMHLDMSTSGFVEFVYHYSIDTYRAAISAWQERLAVDLEAAELQCNITRAHWVKAKDDLKFHQEEMEMFKRRVGEVMDLIEMENLSVTRRRTGSTMSRRKSSIIGSLKLKKK